MTPYKALENTCISVQKRKDLEPQATVEWTDSDKMKAVAKRKVNPF